MMIKTKIAQIRPPESAKSLPTLPPQPFYLEGAKKLKPLVLQSEKTIDTLFNKAFF
jgi:hypothetical protein